jgi:hypothetical protein
VKEKKIEQSEEVQPKPKKPQSKSPSELQGRTIFSNPEPV